MANNVECVRCGQQFDLDAGGIAYQGREGIVTMCEAHIPDKFNDEALAEHMGATLREDDDYYEPDEYEEDWEDPRITYERERGEAFQDRVDMWRREY